MNQKKHIIFVDVDSQFLEKTKEFSVKLQRLILTTTNIEDLGPILEKEGKLVDVIAINLDAYPLDRLHNLKELIISNDCGHIKILSIAGPQSKLLTSTISKIKLLKPLDLINKSHGTDKTLYKIVNTIFSDFPQRKNMRTMLRVSVKCSFGGKLFDAVSYSISKDGIFLETTEDIPLNSNIKISFDIHEIPKSFSINCNVIYKLREDPQMFRVTPQGIGLLFNDLSEDLKTKIEQFVRND